MGFTLMVHELRKDPYSGDMVLVREQPWIRLGSGLESIYLQDGCYWGEGGLQITDPPSWVVDALAHIVPAELRRVGFEPPSGRATDTRQSIVVAGRSYTVPDALVRALEAEGVSFTTRGTGTDARLTEEDDEDEEDDEPVLGAAQEPSGDAALRPPSLPPMPQPTRQDVRNITGMLRGTQVGKRK